MTVDGYIRVSDTAGRNGDSFLSPEIQRDTIKRLVQAKGLKLGEIVEELDVSGGKPIDERSLGELVRRVEAGESDGLVVWKLSRFSRSLLDGVIVASRIEKAGGRLLADDYDSAQPMAKAILGFMLGWAEEERDARREGWAQARSRAVTRGVFPARTPYGYKRDEERRLVIDEERALVVKSIFTMRAGGLPIAEIARRLYERNVPPPNGEGPTWSHSTISQFLRSRAYIGEQKHGGTVNDDAHEAIVSLAEFNAAQTAKPLRTPDPKNHSANALVAGFARCAGCGHTLKIVCNHKDRLSYYCKGPYAAGPCPARCWVRLDELDPFVESWFLAGAKNNKRVASSRTASKKLVAAQRALEAAQEDLDAFLTLSISDPADYQKGYEARRAKLELARGEVANAQSETRMYGDLPSGDMLAAWPQLSIKRRRQLVRAFVDEVNVSKGTGAVAGRVQFVKNGVVVAPGELGEVLAENL